MIIPVHTDPVHLKPQFLRFVGREGREKKGIYNYIRQSCIVKLMRKLKIPAKILALNS